MPDWSNVVPAVDKHLAFTLRRTPSDHPLDAIVTSEDMVGCYTHFWGHRTVPCETPDCPACAAGMPFRWHCYMAAIDPKTREHFLFECTASAAKYFEQHRAAHGTLRGCFFRAMRPKRGRNSKVEILTKPADLTKIQLPPAPNVIQAMCVIWQIPTSATSSTEGRNYTPVVDVADATTRPGGTYEPNIPSADGQPKDQTS